MTTLIYIDWIGLDMLMVKLVISTARTGSLTAMILHTGLREVSLTSLSSQGRMISQENLSPANISVRRLKGRLGEERETSCEAAGRILDSAVQTGYILTVLHYRLYSSLYIRLTD